MKAPTGIKADELRSLRRIASLILALVTALLLAATVGAAGTLPELVRDVASEHSVPDAAISVWVQGVQSDRALLAQQAKVARNPASTIKLLTTFAALETLGPSYAWRTEAYATGPVKDGTLDGDLILKGYGDPFLVTERFWRFLWDIRERGVVHINGDLILDNSFFDLPPTDPADFDGQPHRVYNAVPDALVVNFQSTRFQLIPEKHLGSVRVITSPPLANLTLTNRMRLVNGRCRDQHYRPVMRIEERGSGHQVWLDGDYSADCYEGAVHRLLGDPRKHVYGVFLALWDQLGGTIDGSLRIAATPDDAELLARMESPPLSELVRGMNKFSNNLMTRQLLLTLGAEAFGKPGTLSKGRDAVSAWLALRDLEFSSLVLDNGSGLSRITRISASELAQLLLVAFQSPLMPEFMSSLPLAAIDGTMRKRLRDEPLAGRAHIKTGSLNGVSAMAGYVLSESGERRAVVMLINHPGVSSWQGKLVQDALLRWSYAQ
jgi:D-alanyl-D-alanine carboxypeptidase/D-alanyl-D-alanine-endopeptidase (penicillin-binding protein 4)